jgi:hypothetical protein
VSKLELKLIGLDSDDVVPVNVENKQVEKRITYNLVPIF